MCSFVDIVGFDLPSAECYSDKPLDYVDTLMMTTILPIIVSLIIFIICMTELLMMRKHHDGNSYEKSKKHNQIVSRYFTVFLLLTYLVLPGVSSTIAGAYSCTDVDPDDVGSGNDSYLT